MLIIFYRSYNSTTQDDLWESFSESAKYEEILPANLTVKSFMDTWTTQKGYPLITAERLYLTGALNISQKKMEEESNGGNELWVVPISYATDSMNGSTKNLWINKRNELVKNLTEPGNDSWILLNVDQTGKMLPILTLQ